MDNESRGDGLVAFLSKFSSGILAIIGFVVTLAGFSELIIANTFRLTITLLCIGISTSLTSLFYILVRKREFKNQLILSAETGQSPARDYYYSKRIRRFASIGIFALILLPIVGGGVWKYLHYQPSDRIIILVADFEDHGPNDYRVTEIIIRELKRALAKYPEITVQALGKPVTERDNSGKESSQTARAIGMENKASIFLWGWYGKTDKNALFTIHFEILKGPKLLESVNIAETLKTTVSALDTFDIQTTVSTEMNYVIMLAIGLARYEIGDYSGAIQRFTDALEQSPLSTNVPPTIAYFCRGVSLYYKGNLDDAIHDFQKVILLNSDILEAYSNLAIAYKDKGDYDNAIAVCEKVISLHPDYAEAYHNRALSYSHKRDYLKAIADFDRAINLQPEEAIYYSNRGSTYSDMGDYTHAFEDHDKAISLSINDHWPYYARGLSHMKKADHNYDLYEPDDAMKEYEKAIVDYNKALNLNPIYSPAYNTIGLTYRKMGNIDSALENLNKALNLNPNFTEAYTNRGNTYEDKGDYDQAIEDQKRCITLNPRYSPAYNNLGIIYMKHKNNYDEAIDNFSKAIRLDRQYAEAYNNRGAASIQKGEYEKSLADFTEAISLRPDYVHAYMNRGQAYAIIGEYNNAIQDLDRIVSLTPKVIEVYIIRGDAFNKTGDFDRAIADFNQAMNLSPDLYVAYARRAEAYNGKREYDSALVDCNRAIELNPVFIETYFNRGKAYSGKGDKDNAIADFKKALDLAQYPTVDPKLSKEAEQQLIKLGVSLQDQTHSAKK